MDILVVSVIVAGAVIAIATIGPSIAQGISVYSAMQGIARQPEAAGPIGTNLIIGLAFIESVTIYALVVALLLLFADPFTTGAKDEAEIKAKVNVLKYKIEELQLQGQLDAIMKNAPAAKAE